MMSKVLGEMSYFEIFYLQITSICQNTLIFTSQTGFISGIAAECDHWARGCLGPGRHSSLAQNCCCCCCWSWTSSPGSAPGCGSHSGWRWEKLGSLQQPDRTVLGSDFNTQEVISVLTCASAVSRARWVRCTPGPRPGPPAWCRISPRTDAWCSQSPASDTGSPGPCQPTEQPVWILLMLMLTRHHSL